MMGSIVAVMELQPDAARIVPGTGLMGLGHFQGGARWGR
jgi:hypothetical protein